VKALAARSEKLKQKQLKLDLENAMNGISTKRAKDIADARAKQDRRSAKSKPVIDLGDMSLGSLPEVKKPSKVVSIGVKKSSVGYG
jgi:hypothetical protein